MDFWDSFAKITAAEWLTIAGTFVAAIATAAAVWVSLAIANRARKDAKAETTRANAAEGKLIQAQVDAAETIAKTHREIERDRTTYTLRADAEKRAAEQAILVRVESSWEKFDDGRDTTTGYLYATITAIVVNESAAGISDVVLTFDRTWGRAPHFVVEDEIKPEPRTLAYIRDNAQEMFSFPNVYLYGHTFGDSLAFTVDFTDAKGDRWRLLPDRSLTLLNPRVVRVAEAPAPTS